jgi:hypothetical protein
LGYSDFDLGHRINAFVSKRFEYGGTTGGATTVTLFYNGQSGQRYSYVYGNRIVRDDFSNLEDLIYVPRDASEINLIDDASAGTAAEQWAALDAFIEADDYLSQHRGEYAERNGARLPFTNIVDLKVMQDFFVEMNGKRRTLQVSLDVFNFTNMLHRNWGRRYFLTNDLYGLITANRSGTDTTATYTFRAPSNNVYQMDESGINSSLWQAQLGVRLLF